MKNLVKGCWKCQIRKRPRNTKGKLHTINAERKFEQVQIDLYSGLPRVQNYTAIMVVTNVVTKFVVLAPLKAKTPFEVSKAFWEKFVCNYGFPERVQTDRGKEFTAEFAMEFFRTSSDKLQSTPYHPQSQGLVERFNRTMTNMLAKLVGKKQRRWIDYLG